MIKSGRSRNAAWHMDLATRALADANESEQRGMTERFEGMLGNALHQMDLAEYTGPLYKDTVGRLALSRFSR